MEILSPAQIKQPRKSLIVEEKNEKVYHLGVQFLGDILVKGGHWRDFERRA